MTPLGQMDRYVTIQQMTETRDAVSKEVVETWSTLARVFVATRPQRGRERFTADQLASSGDTVWVLHYREDMDPERVNVAKYRRVTYAGKVYDIVGAVHHGLREWIELTTLASTKVAA